jgi:hypothetical protein
MENKAVKIIEFRGMSQLLGTFWNQLWNGTPLSRAKANSCLEAVAMFVIPFAAESIITQEVMAVAAPLDWVAL